VDDPAQRYLTQWRLERDGELIETPSSWVLPVRRLGDAAMLKVFRPGSDERAGADVLRYFDGNGAVFLMEADADALLMERASGGQSLMSIAAGGGDERAAELLAETVAKLHAPRVQSIPGGLVPLREWFDELFAREAEMPLLERCADAARHLLAAEHEIVVLHGDLHHDNVLDGGARGWLAIDPKGLIGERTYEVANLLGNPWPHGEIVHHADRMRTLSLLYADRLGLDVARVLGFALAHAGLAASWAMSDGHDPSFRLRCAEVLDPLVT
jgi:streptomycin 6-kinase